ncbi:MAG: hypothetical protein GY739_13000, partial [Mesoflavibacter sp.]|nr:hypothetical protein [Mesoflavibacter sp.]
GSGASGGDGGDDGDKQPPKKGPDDEIVGIGTDDEEEEQEEPDVPPEEQSMMVDSGAAESASADPMDQTIMPPDISMAVETSDEPEDPLEETEEQILKAPPGEQSMVDVSEADEEEILGISIAVPVTVQSATGQEAVDPTSNIKVAVVHRGAAALSDEEMRDRPSPDVIETNLDEEEYDELDKHLDALRVSATTKEQAKVKIAEIRRLVKHQLTPEEEIDIITKAAEYQYSIPQYVHEKMRR